MKIVHLTPSFFPHVGGVEIHVAKISDELLAAGHHVTVLTVSNDRSLSLAENKNGVEIRRVFIDSHIRSWGYKFKIWRWFWQQRSTWMSADVIHVHDVFWWTLPFLLLIEQKICTTFHGWEGVYPIRLSAKIQRYVWSLFSVATIHVGAWIQEFYWDKPNAVTYGGAPVVRARQKMPKNFQHLAFHGRLSSENEIEKYLELFRLLKKGIPKLTITWVGDGPLRKECAKLGKVTGMVSNPEKYLSEADAVAVNSYLSLWAALSQGKICLSMYSNPLKKRYLETFPAAEAMLIDSSSQSMAHKISELFKQPKKLSQLSTLAIQSAEKHSWNKVTEQYLSLWQKAGIPVHVSN